MITGEIKNKIDKIWEVFWTGGVTNPLSVIEQLTYLLFIKGIDDTQLRQEKEANLLKKKIESPMYNEDEKTLRWHIFKNMAPEEMYSLFTKEKGVFDFIKNIGGDKSSFAKYMKDAIFMIPSPKILQKVVEMIDEIEMKDKDTKGDVYEYLLSKIAQAGTNGQFRTPRHIIRMMVELAKPTPEDVIIDPACGTAGFLVEANEYLRENNPEIFRDKELKKHFNSEMFHGHDFDSTMLRIGAMNMMMHGVEDPNIDYRDSLSEMNDDIERYSLILANPPFKGSLDYEGTSKSLLSLVKTKKTELLFLALMLRILKVGGRCAVIIPDGVLFGSSKAHKSIRKEIIETHKLEAIISMPSGVFKPYAGVSTGIMIFTKTGVGGTDNVWFYDMQADGYSLDDKRTKVDTDDIPDIIDRYSNLDKETERKRTEKSFFVPKDEITENDYDLSINRYKEIEYEEVEYDAPEIILGQIKKLEEDIQKGISELEGMLK